MNLRKFIGKTWIMFSITVLLYIIYMWLLVLVDVVFFFIFEFSKLQKLKRKAKKIARREQRLEAQRFEESFDEVRFFFFYHTIFIFHEVMIFITLTSCAKQYMDFGIYSYHKGGLIIKAMSIIL